MWFKVLIYARDLYEELIEIEARQKKLDKRIHQISKQRNLQPDIENVRCG